MRPKQIYDNGNKTSDEDVDAVFVGRDDVSDHNPEQILLELPDVIEEIRDWLQLSAYDIARREYRKYIALSPELSCEIDWTRY